MLLFKDISQHKEDIKAIEEKQNIIVKQGQLVSIGELAGGVAHDINTPIAAIKTGILMLDTMTGDRTEKEKEILNRMDNCATKIINIVNSMRNQIRNLGGDTDIKFKISSVVKDIKIITYHEVGKNKSEVVVNIKDDLDIKGDPTKLGQVLTNLVVNAAQAYGEENGGKIEIIVEKAPNNMAMLKVIDYAGGLDPKISPFVFKNILTTKGTSGTGLGLYLAYSVIVGRFNGDITFESEEGQGTVFYITIPRA
ncbi:MAG: HAMP domain-containing sensor histidine kinase [Clostridia bacterium]